MHDHLDVGGIRIADGFFLARPDHPTPVPFRGPRGRTLFTRPNRDASLRDALYDLVESTTRKLFVCSFLLDDPGLVERLQRKARDLRGSVYVVTALKDEWLTSTFADTEPDDAPVPPTKHLVEPLVEAGVQVRGCQNAHAKFAIADDREAIVSTANFDTRGLLATGEAGCRVTSRSEVLRLCRFFSRLWLSRCELEMPHDRNGRFTARSTKRPATPTAVPAASMAEMERVLWTDGDEHHIADAFAATADTAQREFIVSTYDVVGIDRLAECVLSPLDRAVQRGVHVRMLTRIRNPRRATRESLRRLAELGVEVRGDTTNHAKFVIADRTIGALFSANLDAEHGLTSGIEAGVAVRGEDAASLCGYFEEAFHGFESAPFVDRPTHAEVDRLLRARFRRPWGPREELRVRCDHSTWSSLCAAANRGEPVLYQSSDDTLVLIAASESYAIKSADGHMTRMSGGKAPAGRRSSGQLLDHWMSGRDGSDDVRGIFSGTVRSTITPASTAAGSAAPDGPHARK